MTFIVVLGVVLVAITIAKGLYDPDYYWHLTTGRLIATTGVPSVDPFSFTWGGQPWTLHEWLSELLLYWLVGAIGATGAMVVFGLIATLTFAVLAATLRRMEIRSPAVAIACVMGAWVLVGFLTVRPQVISFMLLAGLLALLMSLRPNRPWLALALVPYFLVWANLHGLWVVGLGVVAIYVVFSLAGRTPMAPARGWLLLASCGAVLAVMATPAGPIGILYPLRYVQPGNWGLANIQEWQSPDFHNAANWGFLALTLFVILNAGRATPGWLQVLSIIGILIGLVSVRNDPIAAVLAVPTLALGLDARLGPWRPARPTPQPPAVLRGRRLLELGAAAIVSVSALLIILPASPLHLVKAEADPYPTAAVDRLLSIKPNARVLAEYGWGGYVISRVYDSGGRVFVDGRNDMYSEQILNDYSAVRNASDGWVSLVNRYGVQALLFPPYVSIVKGPATAAGWCEAYRDAQSVLLVRDCTLLNRG